jgi:DNA invertase Pin-like site-specific DNA recombinase
MDGIDTNTAAGRMVFSMVGAISEFERNVISERAGMAAARRRGRHVGRPTKLAPDQLDYALRMIVEEEGRAQVARTLGVDPSTLRRLLMKSETW